MKLFSRAIELILPPKLGQVPDYRKRVEWLILLRLVVTTFLLGATLFFQLQESHSLFVDAVVPLYVLVGTIFVLSLIYALSLPAIPHLEIFSFCQVIIDVGYATVLIYFTGGASSAFTLLYIFPIVASGILHLRRGALIIASMCSVIFALLATSLFHGVLPPSAWPWESPWGSQNWGYLLWILLVHVTIFFIVAIIASSAAEQLQTVRTSLNRRELDYQKLSQLYTNIVRSIPSGIITTDAEDRITFVNSRGSALLGTVLSDLISFPLRTIFPVVSDSIARSGVRQEIYRTVKEVGGRQVHMELSVSDLKDADGVPHGRLVVFEDVTEWRKMEERVRQSERQAAFMRIAAGMAHEIRNPLASIRGATELLGKLSYGSGDQQRLLEIVLRESDRLNGLLTDFLVTVSNRKPKRERFSLSALAEQTVAHFSSALRSTRNLAVEALINKGVEVEGEPTQLKRAFWNLLSNAADATEEGGTIQVVLECDADEGCAILRVQDWGCGIPPEISDRIFDPFTTTKERGTGLGLSFVLSVVKAHHGTVDVDSATGSGSVFVVKLPLAKPDMNPQITELNNGRVSFDSG